MRSKIYVLRMLLCIFIICAMFLAGCWDMVEIDRRLFVGSIGIDSSTELNKFTFTFTIPVVREIVGEMGSGGKPVENVKTIASTITDAERNLSLRLNRDIYFEHMRIIILSEDVVKNDLSDVLNSFMRQTEYNRRSRVAICPGKASNVLDVTPWVEKLRADYLESIFGNITSSGKLIDKDLGDFLHDLNTFKGNTLVSKITPNNTEVSIGGAAVIKDYRLVGWLSEEETQGVNIFTGKFRGGNIVVQDEDIGEVTFTILGAKPKLSIISTGEVPEFVLKVDVNANISSTSRTIVLDLDNIEIMGNLASQKIKTQILKGVSELQRTHKVDVLGVNAYLYKHHPKLWNKYESQWNEIFPDVKISVNVKTKIKNIGATK